MNRPYADVSTFLLMRISIVLPIFVLGLCSSMPANDDDPSGQSHLIVMTYNIHHGEGEDGRVDMERIARVILDADPDLVAVQEVDRFVARTTRADQAQQLADLTGMHMRFGFAINYQGGDFGNVILSKHPIHSYTTYPLPGEPGEDRVLLHAKVAIDSGANVPDTVSFMATHLDTFKEPREAAIPLILDRIPATPTHLYILAGDLNATPSSRPMIDLQTRLELPQSDAPTFTHPARNPDRQIDYILFTSSTSWALDSVWTIDAPEASDHAPLAVRLEQRLD